MTEQPKPGVGVKAGASAAGAEACVDPMVLAAYIDGGLTPTERHSVEDHVSRCDDCYMILRDTNRTLAELGPVPLARLRGIGPWLAIAATVVIAVGGTWAWRRAAQQESAMSALVEAVGERRLFEPRLAGGFRFGPLVVPRRAAGSPETDDFGLLSAAADVKRRASEDPDADNRRALAAAHLLVGQPDHAVAGLEALARERPDEAAILNDLAAAYLVRAERRGRAEDLPRALESASRALELAPELREALFNKALALEALNLRQEAAAAWEEYASHGDDWSPAAVEHRRRLNEQTNLDTKRIGTDLAEAIDAQSEERIATALAESVETCRLHFEQVLLPAMSANPSPAVEGIALFGGVFEQHTGDASIRATADHLAGRLEDRRLRAAYAEYSEARRLYMATRWSEAEPIFAALSADPAFSDSPLQPWAELHVAILAYQAGRTTESARRLANLRLRPELEAQPLLRARVHWILGILDVSAGRFDDALRSYAAGAVAFARARDRAHAAYMAFQEGEVLDYLGRPTLAWQRRVEALARNQEFPEPSRRINVLFASGDHCASAGLPRAAMHFAREARAVAEVHGTVADRVQSELSLARAAGRVRPEDGLLRLAAARAMADGITDAVLRERISGEMQRVSAEVTLATDATGSEPALDRAIEWLVERRAWGRVAPLYLQRGLRRAGRGENEDARSDLQRVVHLIRGMQSPAEDLRVSHARLALSAYDRLLTIALDERADPSQVLLLAEERWQAADSKPASTPGAREGLIASVLSNLDHDTAVLAFIPTERELFAWSVRRGRVDVVRRSVPAKEFARLIAAAVAEARAGSSPGTAPSGALSDLLLRPHAAALMGAHRVFVIPAGPLWRVPFGLLSDTAGILLHVSATVATVPSLRALAPPRRSPVPAARKLLALGFASGAADMPPLPRVEREVRVVARHSASADAAMGSLATKATFARLAPTASVIHFAGHAILNEERPLYSSLIVSSEDGTDDYLTAQEIAGMNLRAADVVTLSTCAAAASSDSYGEGTLSLAGAFLAAGAGAVIAPLWDVSDDGMPELMARLHGALQRGAEPAEAVAHLLRWAETQDGGIRSDARSLVVLTGHGALTRSQR